MRHFRCKMNCFFQFKHCKFSVFADIANFDRQSSTASHEHHSENVQEKSDHRPDVAGRELGHSAGLYQLPLWLGLASLWPSARKPWRPGLPAQRYPNHKVIIFKLKINTHFLPWMVWPWRPGLPAQRYPNHKVIIFKLKLTSFFAVNGLTSTDAHIWSQFVFAYCLLLLMHQFYNYLLNFDGIFNGFWCLELPFPGQVWISTRKSPVCWSIRPAPGKKGHVYYTEDDKGLDVSVCLSMIFQIKSNGRHRSVRPRNTSCCLNPGKKFEIQMDMFNDT